jgi:predicted double-glycine peptidase
MKYFVILCFLFCAIHHVTGNNKIQEQDEFPADSLTITDTALQKDSGDSLRVHYHRDSLQKNYNILLFHLRSENERLELALIQSRRIIAVLFVLMMICCLIFVALISKRTLFRSFTHFRQKKGYQPGIVCLQMMHKYYYKKRITYKSIVKNTPLDQNQSVLTIEDLAAISDSLGFDMKVVKADLSMLYNKLDLPLILYMSNHMSVIYAIKNDMFYLSDPYYGYLKLNPFYFAASWFVDDRNLKGIAIQLYPLKKVKNAVNRRLDLERFSRLKSWDRKNWKNYACELEMAKSG